METNNIDGAKTSGLELSGPLSGLLNPAINRLILPNQPNAEVVRKMVARMKEDMILREPADIGDSLLTTTGFKYIEGQVIPTLYVDRNDASFVGKEMPGYFASTVLRAYTFIARSIDFPEQSAREVMGKALQAQRAYIEQNDVYREEFTRLGYDPTGNEEIDLWHLRMIMGPVGYYTGNVDKAVLTAAWADSIERAKLNLSEQEKEVLYRKLDTLYMYARFDPEMKLAANNNLLRNAKETGKDPRNMLLERSVDEGQPVESLVTTPSDKEHEERKAFEMATSFIEVGQRRGLIPFLQLP